MKFFSKSPKEEQSVPTREEHNIDYIKPAREEIKKTHDHLNRIDKILSEARAAQRVALERRGH
jgi:hypothetical protein